VKAVNWIEKRLDRFRKEKLHDFSRSYLHQLLTRVLHTQADHVMLLCVVGLFQSKETVLHMGERVAHDKYKY